MILIINYKALEYMQFFLRQKPVEPVQAVAPLHQDLASVILRVTQTSEHSYERAVARFLSDLSAMHASGGLDTASMNAVLGTAVDVLFYFNYNLDALTQETNIWYRASLIHQMGHGMLQALAKFRPEMTQRAFFCDAVESLRISPARTSLSPVTCHQWAN